MIYTRYGLFNDKHIFKINSAQFGAKKISNRKNHNQSMIPMRGPNHKNNTSSATTKIKVEVRVRPKANNILQINNNTISVGDKNFNFNRIYGIESTQEEIFTSSIIPMLENFNAGNNSTVFAYGQTGSGKTYTMGISLDKLINFLKYRNDEEQGIVLKSLKHLFPKDEQKSYKCNFYEIYNGDCYDLLNDRNKVEVRESKGEIVLGLKDIPINNLDEAIEILKISCLGRTTKNTLMNEYSSRSHAIFSISDGRATLSFIDLAGSERIKKTAVKGIGIKESIAINSGLLALGNVINALYKKLTYIPFRQNKLTRILQPYLSGNSLTLMLACVSSCSSDVPETQNTLKYASRTSQIENNTPSRITLDPKGKEILELKKEIQRLKLENLALTERKSRFEEKDNKMELLNSFIGNTDTDIHKEMDKLKSENDKLRKEILCLKENIESLQERIKTNRHRKRVTFNIRNNDEKTVTLTDNKASVGVRLIEAVSKGYETSRSRNVNEQNFQNKENHVKLNILSLNSNTTKEDNLQVERNKEDYKSLVQNDLLSNSGLKKLKEETTVLRHKKPVKCLIVDSNKLISASTDGLIIEWKEDESEILVNKDSPIFHAQKINDKLYFTHKRQLICKSEDETIINEYKSYVTTFVFNKTYVFTGHHDGTLCCYDILNKTILFEVKKHKHSITNLLFSDGTIFSTGRDNQIISYTQKEVVKMIPTHYDVVSVLISNEKYLLSAGKDCTIKIWDVKTKKLLKNYAYAHKSWIKAGCIKDNNFCTVSRDGILKIWKYEGDLILIKEQETIKEINTIISYKTGFYLSGENGLITFIN